MRARTVACAVAALLLTDCAGRVMIQMSNPLVRRDTSIRWRTEQITDVAAAAALLALDERHVCFGVRIRSADHEAPIALYNWHVQLQGAEGLEELPAILAHPLRSTFAGDGQTGTPSSPSTPSSSSHRNCSAGDFAVAAVMSGILSLGTAAAHSNASTPSVPCNKPQAESTDDTPISAGDDVVCFQHSGSINRSTHELRLRLVDDASRVLEWAWRFDQ
jgi:hypothetical protein